MSIKQEWWKNFQPLLLPAKGINNILPIDIVALETPFFEKILEMLTLAINRNEMWLFQDCSEHLAQFLKLRLIMNKPIFIRLSNIFWHLITLSPFDNPHFRAGWANLLIELLKSHKKYTEKQDLQFNWKSLYDIIIRYLFPLPRSGVTPAEASMTIPLVKLLRFVRRHFHPEATLEILQELQPLLNPIDDQMTKAIALLSRFIPSDTPFIDNVLNVLRPDSPVWSSTLSKNESFLMNLLCRIARKNIGKIDWSDWNPFLFRLLSNHLSLPRTCSQRAAFNLSGAQPKKYGEPEPLGDQVFRDFNHSFLHAFSKWITCAIKSNDNEHQDYMLSTILTFLQSYETFFHPSNNGGWSIKLSSLVLSLIGRLARRQSIECQKDSSNQSILVSMSNPQIEQFLRYLWKLVSMLLLSKNSIVVVSACSSARYLANLAPELVLNDAKNFISDSLDLDMPHRTIAAFGLVASITRTCSNWEKFPYGPSNAISYLISAIPGIDPNDECKCALALGLIGDFASNLPFFNFSTLLKPEEISKLSDHQNAFVESTASLEGFLILYLEQCFNYIRSVSHSITFKSFKSDSGNGGGGNIGIPRILIIVSNVLFMQISQDYHNFLLERIFAFIRENVYIHASEFTAHFVSSIKGRFVEKTLKLLLPWCFEKLLNDLTDSIMASNDSTSDSSIQESIWIFHILVRLVQNVGSFIIPYLDSLKATFAIYSKCANKKIREFSGKIYRAIFKSLALTYCISWTFWNPTSSMEEKKDLICNEKMEQENYLDILEQTGRSFNIHDVIPIWHVPNENVKMIMEDILDRSITELMNDGINQELFWLNKLYFIVKAYKIYEDSIPLKSITFQDQRLYGSLKNEDGNEKDMERNNKFHDKFIAIINNVISEFDRSSWTKDQHIQLLKILDIFLLYEANPRKGLFLDSSDSDIPIVPKEKTRPRIYHILKAEKRLLTVSDCKWSLLCNRPLFIDKLRDVLIEYIYEPNDEIAEKAENILKDLNYALYNDRIKDAYLIMNNKILDDPSALTTIIKNKTIDSILGFLTCPEIIELASSSWTFASDLFQFLLKISERKDRLKSIEEINIVWELLKITPTIFCTPSTQLRTLGFNSINEKDGNENENGDFSSCAIINCQPINGYMESAMKIFDLSSMECLRDSWNNSMILNLIFAIVSRHLEIHHNFLDSYLFNLLSHDAEILVQSSSIVLIGRLLVGYATLSQDRILVQNVILKFIFTIMNQFNINREFERHYAVILELLSLYYGKWFVEFLLNINPVDDALEPMAIQNVHCIILGATALAITQWKERGRMGKEGISDNIQDQNEKENQTDNEQERQSLYSKLFSSINRLWSKSISTSCTSWYCCFKYATSLKLPFDQYEPIATFVLNAFTRETIDSPSNRLLSILQSMQGVVSNLWRNVVKPSEITMPFLTELSKNHLNDSVRIEASSSILDLLWSSFNDATIFNIRVEWIKEIIKGDHRLAKSLLLQSIIEPLLCGITKILPEILFELFVSIENSKTEYEKEIKKTIEACHELSRCNKFVVNNVLFMIMEYSNDSTRKVPSRQVALAFAWLFYEKNSIFYLDDRSELLSMMGKLLLSGILEVREEASFFLQSIFRTFPSDGNNISISVKNNLCSSLSNIGNHVNLIERHGIVLSACALILSSPYNVPNWLPSILHLLTFYINDRMPISSNVRKMFNEFKRTHQDNWEMERMLFNEEELGAISELLIGPSYYA